MDSIIDKEFLNNPYGSFFKKHPRFIGIIPNSLMAEHGPRSDLVNQVDILYLFRTFRIYRDLEDVRPYELSNAYAYEIALRTEQIKELLSSKTPSTSGITDTWINIDKTLKFENNRYNKLPWKEAHQENAILPKTLPELSVSPSETDFLPIELNMHLPREELTSFLREYIYHLQRAEGKDHLKEINDCRKLIYAKIKIMRPKCNIPKDFHQYIEEVNEEVKKLNLKMIKFADSLFAYDMIVLGFPSKNIASAIAKYRKSLFGNLGNTIRESLDLILVTIDPRTITKWHKEIEDCSQDMLYKRFLSSGKYSSTYWDGY